MDTIIYNITIVQGHDRVWAQSCMCTIMSGHSHVTIVDVTTIINTLYTSDNEINSYMILSCPFLEINVFTVVSTERFAC